MRDNINTERLVLRQLCFEDAPAFSKLANDYDIAKMTGSFPHPFPLLSAEFKVMHLMSLRSRGLAFPYVISRDGGELMGIADLFRKTLNDPIEIGYWIGRPFWGHGYMTEALIALINEAKEGLGASTIIAGVFSDNPASLQVLKKLGFEIMGEAAPYFSNARVKCMSGYDLKLDLDRAASHCAAG